MFSLLSPLTKGLLIVAFLATSVAVSTTYLYLGTRDKLVELETQYNQLKLEYRECSEAKDKVKVSAEQDDTIILDKQEKIDSITKERDGLLSQLGEIPKKTCRAVVATPQGSAPPQNTIESINEIEYVDIDLPFDDDFTRVLMQLDKDKGSGGTPPK